MTWTAYNPPMKILVAVSGGIDSAVVAHMLAAEGHELVLVRFTLWSDPLAPALANILPSKCCNTQTVARAKHVAKSLGLPLHTLDLEEDFKREVVDPFLEGYANAESPNPCIRCNRTIKFGRLLSFMEEIGCEKLATGHYARIARERIPGGDERWLLLQAADATKDQSYYLAGLRQEQLSRALFPLGSMRKTEVRELAKHFGVPVDKYYKESQDLCFFPEKTPGAFLKRHLQDALTPGPIARRDGTVIGSHEGLPLYTVGQRRGLRVGGQKIPLEVVAKDRRSNTLTVAPKGEELINEIAVADLHWISWQPDSPAPFECRLRSLAPRITGLLKHQGAQGYFVFAEPQGPQAPGQTLVLYKGEEVVGCGVMR